MVSLNAPMFSQLKKYAKRHRTSFAMPGHKNGTGMPKDFKKNLFQYDITELEDTESLYQPRESLKKAKKLASEFFESQDTHFLVNGSTGGIHAMLATTCNHGDTVVINRACHISVINACILYGLNPIFIEQDIIGGLSIPMGVDHKELVNILDTNSSVKAVLITSPSYYGMCSDIETIAKITRARGIPLLVDEAHGAHFVVDKHIFPKTALSQGADLVVQSAHKTLNAMNQASYLHVNSDLIDKSRLNTVLSMIQTSSPSYLIVSSCDLARADLQQNGIKNWRNLYNMCEDFRKKISSKTKVQFVDNLLTGNYNIDGVDETRIVMNFSSYKTNGFDIGEQLRKQYNIDVEMCDLFNVVAIATPSNTSNDFKKLSNAIIKICSDLTESEQEPFFPSVPSLTMGISPQEAFYADGIKVRLEDSVGLISKSTIMAYPPAIPIICTGEKITKQSIDYITALKDMKADVIGFDANGYISVVNNSI